MRSHPGTAVGAANQTFQKKYAALFRHAMTAIPPQGLGFHEQRFLDYRLMLPFEAMLVETNVTTVNRVSQNHVQRCLAPRFVRAGVPTAPVQFFSQTRERR